MSESGEQSIGRLVEAIEEQTTAISQLANSNAMLAQAIAESVDEDDEPSSDQYLDGTSAQ